MRRLVTACLGLVLLALPMAPVGAQPAPPSKSPGPAPKAPSPAPAGDPAMPAPPPGQNGAPPVQGQKEWNLSDLLDGVVRMQAAGLGLSPAQMAEIRPILERVLEATRRMTESEAHIKQVLTPDQIKYIEAKRASGELRPDAGLGAPTRPGQDPVVEKVLEILEKRAR